jgi:F-type H+-transporting ATPase subunit delta
VATVVAQDAARALLSEPALSVEQRAGLIADVSGGLDPSQRNFLSLLAQNERLALAGEIAQLFDRLRNEHEGLIEAQITSAFPLNAAQVDSIVATLAERFGRKVKALVSVDAELIGGVSIRMGDEVIDASVRGKLSQLSSALKA